MEMIEEAIKNYYGERCPDHDADCVVCQAWREFDELKKHKENGVMSKFEELKQTRDAETNRRRTMNMLGLTGEEQ